ncbi:MAG: transcriptional regulator KorA [Firmicutes bacterium]|nr:transcriptional regulator KorA [Bacillota bacterium]
MVDNKTEKLARDIAESMSMSQSAFDFAIGGLKLAASTKQATKLVLVDGLDRSAAREQTGVTRDTLNKALVRINENLEALLEAEELVYSHRILLPKMDEGLADAEAVIIGSRMGKKKSRRKVE